MKNRKARQEVILPYLTSIWEEAKELNRPSHREARTMYEYLRGNQLPDDVVAILESRGQPVEWENIIQEIDTALDGMKSMTKTDIEVNARHHEDIERVKMIETLHRATIEGTEWWSHKNRADKDLRVAGLGVMEVTLRELGERDDAGQPLREVHYEHLPVLECFIDLYARRPDLSDARYFHHSRYYDHRLLQRRYKHADNLTITNRGLVRVQRTWYRDPETSEVRIAIWTEGVLLEDKPQPYTRTGGRFSVVARRSQYGTHAEYYGLYRNAKPFQDSINNLKLRIKNMVSSVKVIVEASGVDDVDTFIEDFSQDNSVSVVNDGTLRDKRIEVINLTNNIQQLMALVQDYRAKALQIMGVNPELLGTSTTRQSGVALEIKQNAGLVGLQRYINTSFEMDKDIFEIATAIMQEHFTAETVVIITGDTGVKERFYVNEYERDAQGNVLYRDHKPVQKSILSLGRYDITLNQVPYNNGSSDAKMKAWAEMMKIIPPEKAAALIPSMLRDVGSPQARETQKILEEIDQQAAQSAQQPDPQMQMQLQQMQLQMKELAAKVAEREGKAKEHEAKADLAEAKADDIRNGGDRYDAVSG